MRRRMWRVDLPLCPLTAIHGPKIGLTASLRESLTFSITMS